MNPHQVTEQFEHILSQYTGAKFVVAVDCCSHAIFLCIKWLQYKKILHENDASVLEIPKHTYVIVPNEIIHAGCKIRFKDSSCKLKGEYNLEGSNIWDSALQLNKNMYREGQLQCLSFTGSKKILKLGSGGAILTDDYNAYLWLRRARYSGRREISYLQDNFDMLGWRFYMQPSVAAQGVLLMAGMPDYNEPVEIEYPDLSKAQAFKPYTV